MPKTDDRQRLLYGVMLAVAIWGSILSFGAFLFGLDEVTGRVAFSPSVVRGGIVFVFVTIFVGGWALLLRDRKSA